MGDLIHGQALHAGSFLIERRQTLFFEAGTAGQTRPKDDVVRPVWTGAPWCGGSKKGDHGRAKGRGEMHRPAVRRHDDLRAPVQGGKSVQAGFAIEAPLPAGHEPTDLIKRWAVLVDSRKDDAYSFALESVGQRCKKLRLP